MLNNLKTTFLLALMTGLFLAVGELWRGQSGMIFALVLAGVMNLVAYFFSDKIALKPRAARSPSRAKTARAFTRLSSAWRPRLTFPCPRSI